MTEPVTVDALVAYAGQISEAAQRSNAASELQHRFIHGGVDEVIQTESGPLPSLAKWRQDLALIETLLANAIDPAMGAAMLGFSGRTVGKKLSAWISPDDKGADKTGFLTSDQAFIDAFAESSHVVLEPGGLYIVNSPVIVRSHQTLEIPAGAELRAGPLFVGDHLVVIKEVPGTPAWRANIIGEGKIDAAFMCDWGIEVTYAREVDIKVPLVVRGRLGGIVVGTEVAPSTGVNCTGVSTWFHEEYNVQPGYEINHPDSVGILYINCGDSYVTRCYSIGYRKGIVTGWSVDEIGCHAWGRRVHGPLVTCFETNGNEGSFLDCYADTPHNWKWAGGYGEEQTFVQDASITEVFGFNHLGGTVSMALCKTTIANTENLGGTNNLVIAVGFPEAGGTNGSIEGLSVAGGIDTLRYKSLYKNFDKTITITGQRDKGNDRLVDLSHRGNHLSNAKGLRLIQPVVETASLLESVGPGVAEILWRRGGAATPTRWSARMSSGAETGANAGSDWSLSRYSDAGTFLGTALSVERATGTVSLDGLMKLKEYTVANIPSAVGNYRAVALVSNGNSGGLCLAVSNGNFWLRIALGAGISAT